MMDGVAAKTIESERLFWSQLDEILHKGVEADDRKLHRLVEFISTVRGLIFYKLTIRASS